jgi:phosphoribosylformimino-5-aminoimidazole carboxamide ribotide isomerase
VKNKIIAIPAIDLIDGQCVRLTQGDYAQKAVYHSNPLEVALAFEKWGFRRLHIVDLDGAKAGKPTNLAVLKTIAQQTNLVLDFGGGIKTAEDLETIFEAGASMVSLGSLAVKNPDLVKKWIADFGAEKIWLAADVLEETIALNAWQEKSTVSVFDFIADYQQAGLTQFFCTDVSKDGLLQGVSLALYQKLRNAFPTMHITASGGVATWADIEALEQIGLEGVIVGKALYEQRIAADALAAQFG